MAFAAVFAALAIGVIGVFVVLPRWQSQRMNTVGATDQPVSTGSFPLPEAQPTPTAALIPVSEPQRPSPIPTVVRTRTVPAPAASRPTSGPSRSEKDFASAMSEGLQAMEQGQWAAANAALDRAARIKPDAPEVIDAQADVKAKQRRAAITESIRRAFESERAEKWSEAIDEYSKVLAADPESAAALEGHDRAKARADLDEKLEYHLHNPGRLTTPSVLEDATDLLQEALQINPGGPRIAAQSQRLQALVEIASKPLPVTLESDNLTEVTVYKVGRLGAFATRQLQLRPGTYTAVGSRAGYRDVRVRFAVMPGAVDQQVVIRCTEGL